MCCILEWGRAVKNLDRRWLVAGIALVLVSLVLVRQMQPEKNDVAYVQTELQAAVDEAETAPVEIKVHVAGAVQHAGVYTLREGQRVEDAVQLAGLAENADVDGLNRAAVLSDGQKIVVPAVGDGQQVADGQLDTLIDLNQADLRQLMTLPGIGEVKAQAILDYREQQGNFKAIEEIQQVQGIGSAIFSQIKNKIKI